MLDVHDKAICKGVLVMVGLLLYNDLKVAIVNGINGYID